jgi:hypothetical protein
MPLRLRKAFNALPNTIPLNVRTDRETYLPGDPVEIVVAAGPIDRDLEVDGLVVTLENEVQYTYQVWTGRYYQTRHRTDRETAAECRVALQGKIGAGETPEITLSLEVPRSSMYPGSGGDRIIVSQWAVQALLGIPKSVDASAECSIRVLTPRALHEGRATHGATRDVRVHESGVIDWTKKAVSGAKQDDSLEIDIEIEEPNVAAAGDRLAGTVVIRARETVEADEIRVELRRHEEVRIHEGMHDLRTAARQDLAPSTTLAAGGQMELPFELDVPESISPTLSAPNGTLSWLVSAIVGRKRRPDFIVSREVNVYDRP